MRRRSIFAGLLAVILLSVSCMASACEISCDLGTRDQSCHISHHFGATRAMAMADMPDGSMMNREQPARSIRPALQKFSSCLHSVCKDQPVLLTSETDWTMRIAVSQDIVTGPASLLPRSIGSQSRVHEAPPLPTASPVSLHTTLRV